MWPPFKLALISVRYRSSKNQPRSVGVKPGKVARGGRTSCGEIPIIDPRNRKSSFQCATNTKGHSIRALETNDEKTFTFFLPLGSWCHKCSKFFSRPTRTQSMLPPWWKCANVSSLDIFANDFSREFFSPPPTRNGRTNNRITVTRYFRTHSSSGPGLRYRYTGRFQREHRTYVSNSFSRRFANVSATFQSIRPLAFAYLFRGYCSRGQVEFLCNNHTPSERHIDIISRSGSKEHRTGALALGVSVGGAKLPSNKWIY